MAAAARQILTENPDFVHRMMEHLRTYLGKALQPEEFQAMAMPVRDQPRAEEVQEGRICKDQPLRKYK